VIPVGRGPIAHDSYPGRRDILVKRQVASDRDHMGEPRGDQPAEQVVVAAAEPAFICHGGDIESRQIAAEALRYALIEQHEHSGSRRALVQQIVGDFESRDGLFPPDAWKVSGEFI
jgi:hypothetical protein